MMVTITLEVDRGALRQAEQSIDEFIREVAIELSNELKLEAPVDRGQLRQSIQVINVRKGHYKVAVKAPQALPIQSGTEAFTPPLEPLLEWGERKLGTRKAGAGAWQKIRQEGIEANPYASRAVENLRGKY
jgi:hypothetical protein